jgi:hypothetical protein
MIEKGTITGFAGTHMSGLGYLLIDGMPIPCENAPTVRALEGCFGKVIGGEHNVLPDGGHLGQEIYYSTNAFGILEFFAPVDQAPDELVEAYNEDA